MSKKERINTWTLALCIAVLPPAWAVLAPYINIQTGAAALICAGLYVANGNKVKDAVKISIGFLLGDLWAVIALKMMASLSLPDSLVTFLTLFILGGLAVLISAKLPKFIYLPSWLCGWAVGLSIMGALGFEKMGTLPIQIAVSMLVGVWYVGVFLDLVQKKITRLINF